MSKAYNADVFRVALLILFSPKTSPDVTPALFQHFSFEAVNFSNATLNICNKSDIQCNILHIVTFVSSKICINKEDITNF